MFLGVWQDILSKTGKIRLAARASICHISKHALTFRHVETTIDITQISHI